MARKPRKDRNLNIEPGSSSKDVGLEDQAAAHSPATDPASARLLNELQAHQIQLELQNEEPRQARDDVDMLLEWYTDLYDFAPVGYFTFDRQGTICQVNLTGASLLGLDRSRLVNRRFGLFVSAEALPAFNTFLDSVFESRTEQTCEVVLQVESGIPIYVRMEAAVRGDSDECRVAVVDITESKLIENAQSFLLRCGWPGSGEDFFQSLARYLADTLDMDFVCIDRLPKDCLSAQTVAVYFDGKFEDNVAYTLKDTPCGDVVGQTICSFPKGVRHLFPQDAVLQEMVAEGYVGITLWSSQGQPIGLIAMISRKPLTNPGPAESILQLVAARAAGELERTQAEEEIRSLARFPSENPNPVARISSNGVVLYANPAAESLLQSLSGTVGSEAPPLWREIAAEVMESHTVHHIESEHEGRVYAYYAVAITESGYANLYAVDITDRKHAEEDLAQSNEQVTRILESISDAFFSLDRDWRFTYVNSEAEHMLRQPRERLVGTSIWDQFPEAVGTVFQTEYERAMLEENAVQFESYYPPFDSWFDVRVYPYKNGLSVYFHDCSERHAAQEVLANASERHAHIADVLQQTLIPPQIPMQPEGYEIAARYQPALTEAEVCGDFYDLIRLDDGKIGIIIGDVVGKGLPAAARVATVRHTVRSYAFLDPRPSKVMMLVNDAIFRDIPTENDMLTAFFAVLDTRAGELTYSDAGHEPPLLMHSDGRTEYLTAGGPMLSGMSKQVYLEGARVIQAGDVLVMVTDGITEARIAGHADLFGAEGVERCLSRNVSASAEQIAARILDEATSFAGGSLRDDVAIVVVRRLNKA